MGVRHHGGRRRVLESARGRPDRVGAGHRPPGVACHPRNCHRRRVGRQRFREVARPGRRLVHLPGAAQADVGARRTPTAVGRHRRAVCRLPRPCRLRRHRRVGEAVRVGRWFGDHRRSRLGEYGERDHRSAEARRRSHRPARLARAVGQLATTGFGEESEQPAGLAAHSRRGVQLSSPSRRSDTAAHGSVARRAEPRLPFPHLRRFASGAEHHHEQWPR